MPDNCVTLSSALPTCTLLEHTPPLLCIDKTGQRPSHCTLFSKTLHSHWLSQHTAPWWENVWVSVPFIKGGVSVCVLPLPFTPLSSYQWSSSSLCPAPLIKICLQIIFSFLFHMWLHGLVSTIPPHIKIKITLSQIVGFFNNLFYLCRDAVFVLTKKCSLGPRSQHSVTSVSAGPDRLTSQYSKNSLKMSLLN